jgi:hypothetical protein
MLMKKRGGWVAWERGKYGAGQSEKDVVVAVVVAVACNPVIEQAQEARRTNHPKNRIEGDDADDDDDDG